MNWTTIIIETIIMTIAFTAMVMIPLVKNPVWWIHDYPKDIQEECLTLLHLFILRSFLLQTVDLEGIAILNQCKKHVILIVFIVVFNKNVAPIASRYLA